MKQNIIHWKRKNFLVINDFITILNSGKFPSISVDKINQIAVWNMTSKLSVILKRPAIL